VGHPGLTLGDVYAALTYYHDHEDEIRELIRQEDEMFAELQRQQPSIIDKIRARGHVPNDPVPVMTDLSQRLSEELRGETCRTFRYVEGGTLILYFSPDPMSGTSRKRLMVDCAWRLRNNSKVLIRSLDENKDILRSLYLLIEQTIESSEVDKESGDLRLGFSQGLMLETLGYSVISDLWEFRRSDGYRMGVGPGCEPFERWEERDSRPSPPGRQT
jgi:hypothetical protein